MTRSLIVARGLAVSLLLAGVAQAQQAPVTGRMLGATLPAPTEARPAAPAPAQARALPEPGAQHAAAPSHHADARDAPVAQHAAAEPGDTTRHLLRLQASGVQGGRSLPVLGDQAHASYARYLKSFEHEIPEFFENTVGQSTPGGSN